MINIYIEKEFVYVLLLLTVITGCKVKKDAVTTTNTTVKKERNDWYSYAKHYDERSETYYYLTYIKHKNNQGDVNKLKIAQSNVLEGESVYQFAKRVGATLAFNASMGIKRRSEQEKLLPVGIQIMNGDVIQNRKTKVYTLGIKPNSKLTAYPPGTTPEMIIKDSTYNALTAFIPLIEDFQSVNDSLLDIVPNFKAIHPRQIIAQMENLDILFLSSGGRGFDGKGMTAMDVIRVLQKEGVKFAFMLDGGGSTSTVINGKLITKKIDKHGTKERLRPNFLYFK